MTSEATAEEMMAELVRREREKLPKSASGDCVCIACKRVIPVDTWECVPCETVRRQEAKIRQAKKNVREKFLALANRTDAYGNHFGVPKWSYANFENATFRDLVSPAFLAAIEAWSPANGNLVLCGDSGLGKTSLLVAWLRRMLIEAEAAMSTGGICNFAFISGLDLVTARRTHKLGTSESKIIECARLTPVLFLDEVGFEDLRDQTILELADARYRNELVTVMTTGQTPEGWAERYGAAAWRRFTERAQVVCDFRD